MAGIRRLKRELQRIVCDDTITSIEINDDSLLNWTVTLCGQEGTRFVGQEFPLQISFKESYPFNAPTLRFLAPVDHICVGPNGDVCMDILQDAWSPALTAEMLLIAALSILGDSNERILKDVNEVVEELREKVNNKNTQKSRHDLRLKLKEREFKSRHSES